MHRVVDDLPISLAADFDPNLHYFSKERGETYTKTSRHRRKKSIAKRGKT